MREIKADVTGTINELFVKALDQKKLDPPLTEDDQKRITQYLIGQGYLDNNTRTYRAFENRGEGDPYTLMDLLRGPFAQRLRSVPAIEGTTAAPMFQPIGGMDQISKGFQRAMDPKRITFNAEVQKVIQGDAGVKVTYLDTKSKKPVEVSADYVVLCLPLNLVARLDINLSPELMAEVKNVNYSNSAKMGLQMKRRFWEEDDHIFGGHLYSNLPIGEFSYPSYDYFTKKGVLLGLYSNGPVGNLLDQPVAGAHRARADAREQGASADSHRVRQRVCGMVAQGEIQRGRLRERPQCRAPRQALEGRQPHRRRIGGRDAAFRAGLAGRRDLGGLAGAQVHPRARDARLKARPPRNDSTGKGRVRQRNIRSSLVVAIAALLAATATASSQSKAGAPFRHRWTHTLRSMFS